MKANTSVKATVTPIVYNNAPGVFVYDSEGNQCGILNLHSSIQAHWDNVDGQYFKEREAVLQMETLPKGTVVFRVNAKGKKINLAWVNGNPAGKAAFIAKFSTEELFYNSPFTEDDVFGD